MPGWGKTKQLRIPLSNMHFGYSEANASCFILTRKLGNPKKLRTLSANQHYMDF